MPVYLEVEVGGAGVVVPLARVLDLVSPQLTIVTRGGGGGATRVHTGRVEAARKQLTTKFRQFFAVLRENQTARLM